MRFFRFLMASLVISLAGCQLAQTPDPVEYAYDTFGIDLPKGKQLYLAYNIWFSNPLQISPLNYHSGTIIPFGTPVDIVKAGENSVTFQKKGSIRQFTIENDYAVTLLRDRAFYNQIFTTKNPDDLYKNLDEASLADMKNGIVKANMTREQVLSVFGPPPKFLNPLSEITWTYYLSPDLKTIHIVFKDDKISYIFEN